VPNARDNRIAISALMPARPLMIADKASDMIRGKAPEAAAKLPEYA